MTHPIRVAISGAGGQLGYSLVFRIAAGGMFGQEHPVALSLLETPERRHLAEGIEMELRDCCFPLMADVRVGDEPRAMFQGADWIVLLGGVPLKNDWNSRIELLRVNGPIFVEHGRAINEVASTARILVVANPCNTNCLIAKSHARDVPAEHWFAMNRIDRMRAAALIAEKANVPASEVNRVAIWGNHSETVFPDFHNAWIGNRPARDVITDTAWVRDVFESGVTRRSERIHQLRAGSPAATAAQAVLSSVRSITTPTPFERHFTASVVSDGSYGVPRGLIFGFPLRTEDGVNWNIVQGLYLDQYAHDRIAQNIAELEHEASLVTDLLQPM